MPVGQGLSLFRLLDENYVTFDPTAYNHLFDEELEKVIARTSDAKHRETLERMRGFNWLAYIAASVQAAGFRERLGDPGFLRDIERAVASAEKTVAKRRTATAARQAVRA